MMNLEKFVNYLILKKKKKERWRSEMAKLNISTLQIIGISDP